MTRMRMVSFSAEVTPPKAEAVRVGEDCREEGYEMRSHVRRLLLISFATLLAICGVLACSSEHACASAGVAPNAVNLGGPDSFVSLYGTVFFLLRRLTHLRQPGGWSFFLRGQFRADFDPVRT